MKSKSCSKLFNDTLSMHMDSNEWTLKRLKSIYDNPKNLELFLKYIDTHYPQTLREKISNLSLKINGHHKERIFSNFFIQLEIAKRSLPNNFSVPKKDWANKTWAYLYVDKFGVKVDNQYATFDDFTKNLEYYKSKLKIDNLYLLPINKSPKMDGGYDVSDYKLIDELLGGNKSFDLFMKKVKEMDMNIMVDFVPGHTSKEHNWYKKALKGEQKYIDYYINSKTEITGELLKENGNVYRVYKTPEGKEYNRLLLFPDAVTEHWNKEVLSNDNERYFYSSFYPFQKDLNLQNPDVLEEHLNTLGNWSAQGVSGIRADAISWWVKTEGTSGQHLEETFYISEYFNTFLKYINKNSIFLPELVDASETAIRYLGKTSDINGSIGGQNSNAVFEFEKSVQIFYAGVSGNFTDHHRYLNRTRHLEYPENTQTILYTANHHDEIFLGFLSNEAKQDFQNKIKSSGGIVYKEGNSGGAMLANLLDKDHHKMFHFYKFLFAHKGSVAVYQGSALALTNAWEQTYLTVFKQLEEMKKNKRINPDHEVFLEINRVLNSPEEIISEPRVDSPLNEFIDGRLLHRNKITQSMIDSAMNGENEFFNSFSKLPTLKERSNALNTNTAEEPLDTLRSDIGSFMRRAYDDKGNITQEVAVIKNGTAEQTTININLSQLTNKDTFSLREIELNKKHDYEIQENGQSIKINIEPYETLWLEVL